MSKATLYYCYGCGYFSSAKELAEHRSSHAHPDERFWEWYHRRHG